MKGARGIVTFFVLASLYLLAIASGLAQESDAPSPVTGDEKAVFAAVLNSLEKLGNNTHFLIAESTSTFACGESTCNGFAMGGCNGLRMRNETISARMLIVKHDLPELQDGTTVDFKEHNQQCASIRGSIATHADYRYLSDPNIPRDWKDKYLVYFSRVGFNADKTQALVNISLVSWMDGTKTGGMYILLNKVGDKWVAAGSSAVWQLVQ